MLCLLPFTDSSFFTNRRFLVTLCQASLSAVFSDSICLLHVSMSCFGNFSLYFKHFYYYYIYHDLCMIRDLWSNCCKKIMTSRRLRQWLTFFSNKYFLRYANFFRYNAIAHLLYYIDIEVAQSCPSLWDPMDCSLPGSSLHGIFQARILEWVATSFSRGSSQPRDWTQVSHIVGRHFAIWATREAPASLMDHVKNLTHNSHSRSSLSTYWKQVR